VDVSGSSSGGSTHIKKAVSLSQHLQTFSFFFKGSFVVIGESKIESTSLNEQRTSDGDDGMGGRRAARMRRDGTNLVGQTA
jgi:hypothetical protein